MHPASPSIKYFGLYVALTGVGLLMAPGLVLAPIGVAAPTEVWIRVVGAISIVLGYYYWSCGTAGAIAFFRATVRGRIMFAALTLLLVVLVFERQPGTTGRKASPESPLSARPDRRCRGSPRRSGGSPLVARGGRLASP